MFAHNSHVRTYQFYRLNIPSHTYTSTISRIMHQHAHIHIHIEPRLTYIQGKST